MSVWQGKLYRVTDPSYSIPETLTASRKYPGRFNTHDFGALYVSLAPETAIAELVRRAKITNRRPTDFEPRAMFIYYARIHTILDLTSNKILKDWGLDRSIIESDDHIPCQEVATAAYRGGFEAIKYPSVTGRGDNLAIYYDMRHPGSYLQEVRYDLINLEAI